MHRTAVLAAAAAINLAAFVLYGVDKYRAVRSAWRIPEKTLIALAAFGGGAGAYLAMRLFHHKTRKPLFAIGVPLLALLWLAIFAAVLKRSPAG
ncbi:MAG: DUF1294 domain-containing protein [Solobacterium sp.]|nr:DUF1294 domain-containing protein [Solobacterium sp.]